MTSRAITLLSRRTTFALPMLLLGCGRRGGGISTVEILPLRYDYLTKLRLNVATVDIDESFSPQTRPGELASLAPVPPVEALWSMGRDRLVAAGTSGRAAFKIEDASIVASAGRLQASFAVQLTVATTDGTQSGYAEARVIHTSAFDGDPASLRPALYLLTKSTMDDMNVEFEFQIRRSLRDYLVSGEPTAPLPPPVSSEDLGAPPPPPRLR